jgi:hypothetical protein
MISVAPPVDERPRAGDRHMGSHLETCIVFHNPQDLLPLLSEFEFQEGKEPV